MLKPAVLLASLLVVTSAAFADSLRDEVVSANKKIHAAMLKKDFAALGKAIKSGITADFVYEENGQKMNFDKMMEGMKMGLGSMNKVTVADSKIISVTESGNKGTAVTEHTMAGTMSTPDKKTHTMKFVGTSKESYVKVGGKWKMTKMLWVGQKQTLDGKPLDMSKPGG